NLIYRTEDWFIESWLVDRRKKLHVETDCKQLPWDNCIRTDLDRPLDQIPRSPIVSYIEQFRKLFNMCSA
ncbi:hypothetical protein V1478_010626, partial [Vespula squamosa]